LGFGVWGLGFRGRAWVWGLGFGLGFGIGVNISPPVEPLDFGFRVWGLRSRVRVWGLGIGVRVWVPVEPLDVALLAAVALVGVHPEDNSYLHVVALSPALPVGREPSDHVGVPAAAAQA